MRDNRVPARTKAAPAGLVVYLVSPWDIIPDFIPGLGQLDDAVVAILFVDGTLNQVDDEVLVEHWTGELETFPHGQSLSRTISYRTPDSIRNILYGKAISAGGKDKDLTSPR